jgi:beta-galactosidase
LSQELGVLTGETAHRGDVALVYDYEAAWALDIQPQSREFGYAQEVFRFYRAVRQLGLNVDIVPQGGDLTGYRLVLVPPLPIVRLEFLEALRHSSGIVLFAPRLGSKTTHFHIPDNLPPGPMQEFLPLRVLRVDSLPRFAPQPVRWNEEIYAAEIWREQVASDLEPVARFAVGHGALFRHERFFYLAGVPDDRWLGDLLKMAAMEQELPIVDLPEGVRTRRLGSLRCFFNYNPYPVQLAPRQGFETLIGGTDLTPAGVLIGRETEPSDGA